MHKTEHKGRFVGHSPEFSIERALDDAVSQAMQSQSGIADAMIEFEIVGLRGRVGGIAGFRDVWVEINVPGLAGSDEPTMTTMAVGEEGGDIGRPKSSFANTLKMTTLTLGEEGGESR
jgi:hypothetical protein